MNKMENYQLQQKIKDRYSYIFKEKPEMSLSKESLDSCAHIIAGIIEKYGALIKEASVHAAQTYFIDVVGYYVLLSYDIQKSNEELLKILKQREE